MSHRQQLLNGRRSPCGGISLDVIMDAMKREVNDERVVKS